MSRCARATLGFGKFGRKCARHGRAYTFTDGTGPGRLAKAAGCSFAALFGKAPGRAGEIWRGYYRERAEDVQRKIWQAWQDGTIRQTAIALQTTLQLFHTHDGAHSEENSITTRVGHDEWKDVTLILPPGAGAAPLRLDFYSALTTIDLSLIRLTGEQETYFCAEDAAGFDRIRLAGDAARLPHPQLSARASHRRGSATSPAGRRRVG